MFANTWLKKVVLLLGVALLSTSIGVIFSCQHETSVATSQPLPSWIAHDLDSANPKDALRELARGPKSWRTSAIQIKLRKLLQSDNWSLSTSAAEVLRSGYEYQDIPPLFGLAQRNDPRMRSEAYRRILPSLFYDDQPSGELLEAIDSRYPAAFAVVDGRVWTIGFSGITYRWNREGEHIEHFIPKGNFGFSRPTCLSLDGQFMGCLDGSVVACSAAFSSYNKLYSHNEVVYCIATASNLVASADRDGKLILWDLTKGSRIWEKHQAQQWFYAVAFSKDGKYLAAGCNQDVLIFDTQSGELLKNIGNHPAAISTLHFSADGKYLLSGDRGDEIAKIKMWDVVRNTELFSISAHDGPISAVIFADPDKIISGSWDNKVKVWDITTQSLVREFSFGGSLVIGINYDGNNLIVVTEGKPVEVIPIGRLGT